MNPVAGITIVALEHAGAAPFGSGTEKEMRRAGIFPLGDVVLSSL